MTDLRLEREFPVTPERLFAWISDTEKLLQWWGPEGMTVPEHTLNFHQEGPWSTVMTNADGDRYHVSGVVTHVRPPQSIGFTWGWHDETGARGHESHVTLTVEAVDVGARLVIDHRNLDSSEQAAGHQKGWESTLRKLASKIQ
ncbi:SRPBCC family protein [Phaeobacter inhibens]|uniref:SRPBCC family protein n=1 Tax=Phaeobacter inhibens TaxID=221822 RepID=UPI0021A937C2|nr:SRPBCC domain-containing protein [Phaeobacter inhibens]UWR45177.1 SRPBCC domain-containing protein [Phaeobacter inhibens]UWR60729.1 SRPBCC domain-containing protein [Phaeobacter inhibens]UWR76358.1 SRPBCC domain-containing protein [Phaeobacter inhibens]UWR80335.1 SRPBCC domain-containing protein [Phaeobacter inhibens]